MLAYSGKGKFVVELVDLGRDRRASMAELLKVRDLEEGGLVAASSRRDTPPIEADATQLRQVVMNLVINASEAIGEGAGPSPCDRRCRRPTGRYSAETTPRRTTARGQLRARSRSPTRARGMDDETRRRIFDPFFTTKFTGRGLGLAAVLGIVRGHSGAMKVESEPGEGTGVHAHLPGLGQGPRSRRPRPPAPPTGTRSGTVLVVDDDGAVRSMAAACSSCSASPSCWRPTGTGAARAHGTRGELAFVLLDLTMPGMSGKEVIDELQRLGATTPIVLTSGYNARAAQPALRRRGVAAFLQKPYEMDQLRAAALNVVAARVG